VEYLARKLDESRILILLKSNCPIIWLTILWAKITSIINCICATVVNVILYLLSVSLSEYIFTFCVMCAVFSFLFAQGGQLVGLMPVLAACHLIYVSSIVCIVFLYMLVANKVLSLSTTTPTYHLTRKIQGSVNQSIRKLSSYLGFPIA